MKLPSTTPLTARLRLLPAAIAAMASLQCLAGEPCEAHSAAGRVALLELYTSEGWQSAIKAGENQGKLLRHDFVVRELIGPLQANTTGQLHWKSTVALRADWKRPELSLVAFVQDQRNGEILQALRAPMRRTLARNPSCGLRITRRV